MRPCWWLQDRLSESRDDDVTRLESRVTELECECRDHVVKIRAISDERQSLTNQLRELSRRQRQVSSDWLNSVTLLTRTSATAEIARVVPHTLSKTRLPGL